MRFNSAVTLFTVTLFLVNSGAGYSQDASSPEKELLKENKIATDAKSLLSYLEKRTGNDAAWQQRDKLVQQLGAKLFTQRTVAARKLVEIGPAALPLLRTALDSNDSEVVNRAKECINKINGEWNFYLDLAVVRLLLREAPDGAFETLFKYLPYTADPKAEEDIWFGLYRHAKKHKQLLPLMEKGLKDELPPRRALAGCVVGALGNAAQRKAVLELLKDPDAMVRLRVAQGLLSGGEAASIPVLIELLNEPSVDISWSAEELLHWVAIEKNPPEAKVGAGTATERGVAQKGWAEWWKKNEKTLDLSKRWEHFARPGLILATSRKPYDRNKFKGTLDEIYAQEKKAAMYHHFWLIGCDGKPRWQLKSQPYHYPQLLPGNKLLVLGHPEFNHSVLEIDLQGKVLWSRNFTMLQAYPDGKKKPFRVTKSARSCQRLPNGNIFLSLGQSAVELSPDGQLVWQARARAVGNGRFDTAADLLDSGRLLCHDRKWGVVAEIDPRTGKILRRITPKSNPSSARPLHGLPNGHYLVELHRWNTAEMNLEGKIVWQIPFRGDRTLPLPNGNIVFGGAAHSSSFPYGQRDFFAQLLESTPEGQVVWEVYVPEAGVPPSWGQSRMLPISDCLPLIRLGFDRPRSDGFDLLTNIPYLLKNLKNEDVLKRDAALSRLAKLDNKAQLQVVPQLIELLQNPDKKTRDDVSESLSRMEVAYPFLLKAAKDKRMLVRAHAIRALAPFFNQTDEIITTCIRGMQDENPMVRSMAARCLYFLGYQDHPLLRPFTEKQIDRMLPQLIKLLDDPATLEGSDYGAPATEALNLLQNLGPKAKAALPALIEKVKQKNYPYLPQLLQALRVHGPEANQAVPALTEIIKSRTAEIAPLAIGVLGAIGPKAKTALPELVRLARIKSKRNETLVHIRRTSIWALGEIGLRTNEVLQVLADATKDEDPIIRNAALRALKRIQ